MAQVRKAGSADVDDWLGLRLRLWPNTSLEEHHREIVQQLRDPRRFLALLACDGDGQAVGFAEIALRVDPVNGCVTSPVAFVEGIYVEPGQRRRGAARALLTAAEQWAAAHGCRELAADVLLEDIVSRNFHQATGFMPTERVIFFRKELR
jgi:aminoglycoside 6'-N-acetyltransferase I